MATTRQCANCGDVDEPFPCTHPDPHSPGEWVHPDGCPDDALLARLASLCDDASVPEDDSSLPEWALTLSESQRKALMQGDFDDEALAAALEESLALSTLDEPPTPPLSESVLAPQAGAGSAPKPPPGHYQRVHKRDKQDLYITPPHAVTAILSLVPPGVTVWEPCNGTGAISDVFAAAGFTVRRTDLLEPAADGTGINFLTDAPPFDYDVIVTNPPWSEKTRWLERLEATGKPYIVLYPLSAMSGVGTGSIWDQRKHRFFIFKRAPQFFHAGRNVKVGDCVWIAGGGLAADAPMLNWLDDAQAPAPKTGKGKAAVSKAPMTDEEYALSLAQEELEQEKKDHAVAVNLALADMAEETALPVHVPLLKMPEDRLIRLEPVLLGGFNTLELFAGTGSFSKGVRRFKPDAVAVTVEMDPAFGAAHPTDILRWDYRVYPPGSFKWIWASPPCREFSAMRTGTGIPRNLAAADRLCAKALEIAHYFKPEVFVLENPSGNGALLPKRMPLILARMATLGCGVPTLLPPAFVAYCQYGYTYEKPTALWSTKPLTLTTCPHNETCPAYRTYTDDGGVVRKGHKSSIGNYSRHYEKVPKEQTATVPPVLVDTVIAQITA